MAGWPHQLDGHEFEQALGVGDERESLAQKYISHSSIGQKPDIRCQHGQVLLGDPFQLADSHMLIASSCGRKTERAP